MTRPTTVRWIGIGELAVVDAEPAGVAGLGSCVALALMENAPGRRAVVLHIALPGSGPDLRYARPAVRAALAVTRYLDRTVPWQAWLACAAHLFATLSEPVGPRLAASVLQALAEAQVEIAHTDLGGVLPRRVAFDPTAHRMWVVYGPPVSAPLARQHPER